MTPGKRSLKGREKWTEQTKNPVFLSFPKNTLFLSTWKRINNFILKFFLASKQKRGEKRTLTLIDLDNQPHTLTC